MRRGEPGGPHSTWIITHRGAFAGAGVGAGCPFPRWLGGRWVWVFLHLCRCGGPQGLLFFQNQEIEELTKICDELIAKLGKTD